MSRCSQWITTPIGRLQLIADEHALTAVLWESKQPGRVPDYDASPCEGHPLLLLAEQQLHEYFRGERTAFSLPLAPQGTVFQQRVWSLLRSIPYGETRSYLELARMLGDANRTRAVGAANGRNPLSIVVPCHRVVGTAGGLTGFAGGLAAKRFLLDLENGGRLFPDSL